MARIDVPYLVAKTSRGRTLYFWQPSAALKAAKWTAIALGSDPSTAIEAARRRNAEVAAWRAGDAAPRTVAKHAARGTVSSLIAAYRRDRLPGLAPNTQHTYGTALRLIEAWAGPAPLAAITRKRVKTFQAELAKPAKKGGEPRLTRAAGTLRVLRTLVKYALDEELIAENPATKIDIITPLPRDQVWPDHAIDAMVAAAERLEVPSIGTAVLAAAFLGQREGDILRLRWNQWKAGRVRLRQGKTGRWIEVPAVPELAARLEALAAANFALPAPHTHVLRRESDGLPFSETYFQREFLRVKQAAIAGLPADPARGLPALEACPELDGLQYRDLRRTAVVRLAEAEVDLPGIAAISGHQIETCKRILEIYMPRTGKMAAAAITKLLEHRAKVRGDAGPSLQAPKEEVR